MPPVLDAAAFSDSAKLVLKHQNIAKETWFSQHRCDQRGRGIELLANSVVIVLCIEAVRALFLVLESSTGCSIHSTECSFDHQEQFALSACSYNAENTKSVFCHPSAAHCGREMLLCSCTSR
eukprot:TRINITY_DN10476_c0_g1_i4.p2 TRINITY_DN10476_c0_g1~~TRINITY_DN10476_c0_g1_i4.p2  ORF type:complete len:122 (-),score=3.01 TRINITY_DN10476_c0_g1_i4:248-613(-)